MCVPPLKRILSDAPRHHVMDSMEVETLKKKVGYGKSGVRHMGEMGCGGREKQIPGPRGRLGGM